MFQGSRKEERKDGGQVAAKQETGLEPGTCAGSKPQSQIYATKISGAVLSRPIRAAALCSGVAP